MTKDTEVRATFRPYVSKTKLLDLAEETFGLVARNRQSVRELESYDDRNFHVRGIIADGISNGDDHGGEKESEYVLKVLHPKNTYADGFIDSSVKITEHLNDKTGQ